MVEMRGKESILGGAYLRTLINSSRKGGAPGQRGLEKKKNRDGRSILK